MARLTGLTLAIVIPVVIFNLEGRGTETDGLKSSVPDTFSRAEPGPHDAASVSALEPRMTLLRCADQVQGAVHVAPPAGTIPVHVEVLGPTGEVLCQTDGFEGQAPTLRFNLPSNVQGAVTARVVYRGGDVWSFTATL